MATVTIRISPLTRFELRHNSGFSLFEILIVLMLIAGLMSLIIPNMRAPKANLKTVVRELSLIAREVRNQARLKNVTYRIVFDLDAKVQNYVVEASSGPFLIQSEESEKRERDLKKDEKPQSPLQKVEKPLKKPKELPAGIKIKQIEVSGRQLPLTNGMAFIHFSPEGLVEESIIQISSGKDVIWSIIFNPLTGQSDIVEKALSLKELKIK